MLNFLQSTKTCTVEFGSGGTQDQSRPGALSVLEISGMMICNSYIYDISLRNPRHCTGGSGVGGVQVQTLRFSMLVSTEHISRRRPCQMFTSLGLLRNLKFFREEMFQVLITLQTLRKCSKF